MSFYDFPLLSVNTAWGPWGRKSLISFYLLKHFEVCIQNSNILVTQYKQLHLAIPLNVNQNKANLQQSDRKAEPADRNKLELPLGKESSPSFVAELCYHTISDAMPRAVLLPPLGGREQIFPRQSCASQSGKR